MGVSYHFQILGQLLHHAVKELCENCRSIAYLVAKLQLVEVEELDVCGSLVLSNPVTYTVCPSYRILASRKADVVP